jgi:hypothetical protein
MSNWLSKFLDHASEFLAHRKGLLPLVGILFVLLNFLLNLFPGIGWFATSHLLLHLGVIIAIMGFLLAQAL